MDSEGEGSSSNYPSVKESEEKGDVENKGERDQEVVAPYVRRRMNIDGREERGFEQGRQHEIPGLDGKLRLCGEFKGGSRKSTEEKSGRPEVRRPSLRLVVSPARTSTVR